MEIGDPGFERVTFLEASGLIFYDQIDTQRIHLSKIYSLSWSIHDDFINLVGISSLKYRIIHPTLLFLSIIYGFE